MVGALIVVSASMLAAAPVGAAPDPERGLSTPTGWQWWKNRSATQLRSIEGQKMRVTDLEVDSSSPHRFSAALVRNAGGHERDGNWFYARTPKGVDTASKGQGRRLIDIEVYRRYGKLRFAGVTVRNAGASGKFWDWGHGVTAKQLGKRIEQLKIRLIDLEVYETSGGRRYAWVGMANHGEDARAWWWYLNQTASSVQKLAVQHGARLLDVERRGSRWNVILVRNDEGVYTRHTLGRKQGDLGRFVASNGVRITDLERYGDRFAAVTIDNVDAETGRLRRIIRDRPYGRGFFGAFSKRVGGKTYVGLAHRTPYQPLSVQKLVPHLYVMDRWDANKVSMSDTLFWRFPKGGGAKEPACPGHQGETVTTATTLGLTLKRSLHESLNLAHEELLLEYHPDTITERVRDMGLTRTQVYFGCKHPGQRTWLSNRSTLADMGKLFERVDRQVFFPNRWQAVRDRFYQVVKDWDVQPLRTIVAEEAAKQGKDGALDAFMARVKADAKGGGADSGPHGDDGHWIVGRALSWRIVLPFQEPQPGGGTTLVDTPFVGGFFVNDMRGECHEESARKQPRAQTQDCRDYVNAMGEAFATVYAEVMRVPIREALQTWPPDTRASDETSTPPAGAPAPAPSEPPEDRPEQPSRG